MKTLTTILTLALIILVSNLYTQNADIGKYKDKIKSKSDVFIENKGQWPLEVKFLTKINGLNAWITDYGVVYDYFKISGHPPSAPMHGGLELNDTSSRIKGHILKMSFLGCQKSEKKDSNQTKYSLNDNVKEFEGIGKNEAYYNYIIGSDSTKWASYVGLYQEAIVRNIYKGIDVRYYFDKGDDGKMAIRYDFVINPGADVSQIRIKFEGTNGIKVDENGDLVIRTSLGDIKHTQLKAFQIDDKSEILKDNNDSPTYDIKNIKNINEVDCRFVSLGSDILGLAVKNYDRTKPLIIDPLVYSTYVGAQDGTRISSIDVRDDYVYITGYVPGGPLFRYPTTTGAYRTSIPSGGSSRGVLFVTKMNTDGTNLVFSTYICGPNQGNDDEPSDIYVDGNGNSLITGWSYEGDFPFTRGVVDSVGGSSAFLTKLNSNGSSLIFSTFLGGNSAARGFGCLIDNSENCYVVGYTTNYYWSDTFETTTGAYDRTWNGDFDIFAVKLNSTATSYSYSTLIGGSLTDKPFDIGIDSDNNLYIVGSTNSTNFPITSNSYDGTFNSSVDAFALKLNSTGSDLVYSTFLGSDDYAYSEYVNNSGECYITGTTTSTSFPTTTGSYDRTYNGGGDGFISKLNSTGSGLTFSSFLGGNASDNLTDIQVDNGKIYIYGYSGSTNYPLTSDAYSDTQAGLLLSKLNSDCSNLIYSTRFGNTGDLIDENGTYNSAATNALYVLDGKCYFTGLAFDNFPVTNGAYQTTNRGANNGSGFVTKLDLSISLSTSTLSQNTFCAGSPISIPFTLTGNFDAGNRFTAQLSNSTGSFANPTTIGTLDGSSEGTIDATIPSNTAAGTGYRIRVVSSSPAVTGSDNGANITINALPKPAISGADVYCSNNIQEFHTAKTTGHTYKWSATNGSVIGDDNEEDVKIRWFNLSSGTVSLVETITATGCKDSVKKTITLNPLPDATINGDYEVCEKSIQTYTAVNATGNVYKWSLMNGTLLGPDNTTSIDVRWNTGNGSVKLVVSIPATGCIDSTILNVGLDPLPTPVITGQFSICKNSEQTYSVSDNPDHGFKWYVTGGTIIGPDNKSTVNINWSNAGSGTVKIVETIYVTRCTDSVSRNITINPLPDMIFTGNIIVCGKTREVYITSGLTGHSYKWYATGGTIAGSNTNRSVAIDWGNSSSGTVKLVETIDETGCKDSLIKIITINPLPKPQFSGQYEVCGKETQTYYVTQENGVTYKWEATGGTINGNSTGKSVSVTWGSGSVSGNLKITGTITATGCSDTSSEEITIHILPTPTILGPVTVPQSTTQTYSTPQVDGITNQWTVSGGIITGADNGTSIQVNWGTQGQGWVKLWQTDNSTQCKDSAIIDIDISSGSIAVNGSKNVCEKNSYIYSTPADAGKSNQWYAAGGAINGPSDQNSVQITWGNSGQGDLKLVQKINATGTKDSVGLKININPLPKPQITGEANTCSNCTFNYSSNSTGDITNQWQAQGGTIEGSSTNNTVNVKWGIPGNGKVTLVQTNSTTGCKDSTSIDITIGDKPSLSITGAANSCENSVETYSTSDISGAVNLWTVQGGNINGPDNEKSVKIQWGKAGNGLLKLVQTNQSMGFKDSVTKNVTINAQPVVSHDAIPDVCETAAAFALTGGHPIGGSYSGTGVSGNQFDPKTAGAGKQVLLYTFTDANNCSNTINVNINVLPAPSKPTITEQGDSLISSADYGNRWYFKGTVLTNDTNKVLEPKESGIYSLKVIGINGCESEISSNHYYPSGGADPIIIADANDINFKGIMCEYAAYDTLGITNSGGSPLIISKAEFSGQNAGCFCIEPPFTQLTLNQGEEHQFLIKFNPNTAGVHHATVTFTSNAKNSPEMPVNLNAKKDSVGFKFKNGNLFFNPATDHTPATLNDTIINTGNIPITWTNPGQLNSDITIVSITPLTTPPDGGISTMMVLFTGDEMNAHSNFTFHLTENTCNLSVPFNMGYYVGLKAKATLQAATVNLSGYPGDIIEVPVYLRNGENVGKSGASAFLAELKLNSTMLIPIYDTPKGTVNGNERIIPLTLPIVADPQNKLETLIFQAALGTDTVTTIEIGNLSSINGFITIDSIPGKFTLKGVCMEGGFPRLINMNGTTQLLVPKPNPIDESLEIEYETIEEGVIKLYITDTYGKVIQTISQKNEPVGKKSININTGDLPSGVYFINMRTPTAFKTAKIEVIK